MKKIWIAWLLVLCLAFTGCNQQQQEKVNLSDLPFVNVEWTRRTEVCTETLVFRGNGDCSYYCACGEPVNDDDLCEGYRYDPETKTICLEFMETTPETVTKFTVKSCDGDTLVLDIGGEICTFKSVQEVFFSG